MQNDLALNQPTIGKVENSPVEEEPEVPSIDEKPDETVHSEKGYYHGVFVLLNFNKEDGVNMKEDKSDK